MCSLLNKLKFINYPPIPWTYCITSKLKMSGNLPISEVKEECNSLKREHPVENELDEVSAKKALIEKQERVRKRKFVILIAYLGQGYLGLQRNPGTKTIEEDMMVALLKSGLINEESFNQPQLIQFQRAARTDKGVSALRQTLSLKLPENSTSEAINEHLPEQIRTIAIKRVTKGFNSKSACDGRTYSYLTPTFAFALHGSDINTDSYRLSTETRDHVASILKMFEGTHNFHNFTSKRLPSDPSSHRYMMSFTCGDPFLLDGVEFVTLKVKGQSFMLHQIRKMVGLTIAIVRGLTTIDTLTRAWDRDRLDIPIAPGLGLLLEEVHYDRYNERYGSDGMHEKIEWDEWNKEIEEFRKKFILPTVVETEKKEKSMLTWLDSLNLHSFDVRTEHVHSELDKALEKNQDMLAAPTKIDALLAAARAVETET